MANGKTALVLGATGGIGGAMARTLLARGWQVHALTRNQGCIDGAIRWIPGDAMQRSDVIAAAHGADLIVHAVNPPGYRRWAELVIPMMDNSIAAAQASGARILLPGTVYNYGPDAGNMLSENSPQHPLTRKGAIRVEMEQHLRQAAENGIRSLIVRAGDFFGAGARNNWFSLGLVKPGRPLRSITYPGKIGIGHQWSYLPDTAESMMRLIEQEQRLATFATFHLNGHWDSDGTQMVAAIGQACANLALPVRSFPWWLVKATGALVPLFHEMNEMRYLWQQPLRMDNTRLRSILGSEPHTPLVQAVQATLIELGCLPAIQEMSSPKNRLQLRPDL